MCNYVFLFFYSYIPKCIVQVFQRIRESLIQLIAPSKNMYGITQPDPRFSSCENFIDSAVGTFCTSCNTNGLLIGPKNWISLFDVHLFSL